MTALELIDPRSEYSVQRLEAAQIRAPHMGLPDDWVENLRSLFASLAARICQGGPQNISDLYTHELAETVLNTPISLSCPLCGDPVGWAPAPIDRWWCRDCATFWRDTTSHGQREHADEAVPPLHREGI